jgi:hypothetical protein
MSYCGRNMEGEMQEVTLAILNPVAMIEVAGVQPARRITDLTGKRIGLYWNRKARGDVALRKVEEVLTKRFTGLRFTWFETFINVPLSSSQIQTIKDLQNDAIISTTGD